MARHNYLTVCPAGRLAGRSFVGPAVFFRSVSLDLIVSRTARRLTKRHHQETQLRLHAPSLSTPILGPMANNVRRHRLAIQRLRDTCGVEFWCVNIRKVTQKKVKLFRGQVFCESVCVLQIKFWTTNASRYTRLWFCYSQLFFTNNGW